MNLKDIWVNLKSLFYATVTIVGVVILIIAGLMFLPIAVVLIAIFILFVVYKVVISSPDEKTN